MTMSPLLLGTLPEWPSFIETIVYQFNGLMIVFLVLGSLWLLLELSGAVFRRRDERLDARAAAKPAGQPAEKTPRAATPGPGDSGAGEQLPPAIVAAIVAATHVAMTGRKYRLVSVTPATNAQQGNPWAIEGRREIFTSHKLR